MRTTPSIILFFLILLTPLSARSHGLFWQSGPAGWVLMEGHLPGQEHGGDPAAPCTRELVVELLRGERAAGGVLVWTTTATGDPVVVAADAVAAFALLDWGWWTKTVEGTRNVHPAGIEGVLQAWSSRETVKHVAAWAPGAEQPVGRGLEVTPLSDPLRLKAGAKVAVRVTLDGQPVAGAVVTCGGKARGDSGPDGTIRLKLREPGLQVIRATLRRPAADPSWAEDVQTGTLTFSLEVR